MTDKFKAAQATIIFSVIVLLAITLLRPDWFWLGAIVFGIILFSIWLIPMETTAQVDHQATADASEVQTEKIRNALIEALGYPVYILNERGEISYVNEAGTAAFGNSAAGDLITLHIRQPEFVRAVEEALNSERHVEMELYEQIPSERWFAVSISPIPGFETDDNISERKRFLVGFQDLTEARRTDRMRSDFIANASHELRTPLASLLGYVETIKGAARDDPKAREKFLDIMLDQANRMSRLINDLLSLSQIELKAHVKPSDEVNLTQVLEEVIISLKPVAENHDVQLQFSTTHNVFVMGDKDELVQVFENLIENACKYGQDGKKVVVGFQAPNSGKLESDTQNVQVMIKDFGPGIAIEDQQRITERFYRVDVARSREKQGTGLGLAIVKHILNRHKTRLSIRSEIGKGAEFSVSFPVERIVKKREK